MLNTFSVDECDAVGFEILAPGMLDLLAKEGIEFDFRHKDQLLKLCSAKLQRLSPEMMYKLGPSALLFSLEAFHGWDTIRFDVDQVRHHMVKGSMMASPAATASYLMKAKNWDDAAEAYLRLVYQCVLKAMALDLSQVLIRPQILKFFGWARCYHLLIRKVLRTSR
jgi:hypothetical protein